LAKRSIVGSKVAVLRDDGLYYAATIQAVKTDAHGVSSRYAVRHDAGPPGAAGEYSEVDLIGPGFQSTSGITLKCGQRVFVTFTGREIAGQVTAHRPDVDQVHITLCQTSNSKPVEIIKRMEEVRLMESRKSLRLMDQHGVVDSPASAVISPAVGASNAARRCGALTTGIDVPGAYVGSRKRRSSPCSSDVMMDQEDREEANEDLMDECAAAMVLMRLSCSPHSPRWEELAAWQSNQSSSSSSGAFSWGGSANGDSPPHRSSYNGATRHAISGRKLKFRSGTPSPPLIGSAPAYFSSSSSSSLSGVAKFHQMSHDDGIVSDESISESDEGQAGGIIYQCTWPGCSLTTASCAAIESHVRTLHLGPRQIDEEVSDHEEEFYYTEIEDGESDELDALSRAKLSTTPTPPTLQPPLISSAASDHQPTLPQLPLSLTNYGLMASSPPTLSHMDMARPPHEDPEYQRSLLKAARPISIPSRVRSISWSSGYGYGSFQQKQAKVIGSNANSKGVTSTFSVKSSPVRRPRGEAKKCRKVYGMEHREQWCTQCKWKKACTRFGD